MTPITDHKWRPSHDNVTHIPWSIRPCGYHNCGQPRGQHDNTITAKRPPYDNPDLTHLPLQELLTKPNLNPHLAKAIERAQQAHHYAAHGSSPLTEDT